MRILRRALLVALCLWFDTSFTFSAVITHIKIRSQSGECFTDEDQTLEIVLRDGTYYLTYQLPREISWADISKPPSSVPTKPKPREYSQPRPVDAYAVYKLQNVLQEKAVPDLDISLLEHTYRGFANKLAEELENIEHSSEKPSPTQLQEVWSLAASPETIDQFFSTSKDEMLITGRAELDISVEMDDGQIKTISAAEHAPGVLLPWGVAIFESGESIYYNTPIPALARPPGFLPTHHEYSTYDPRINLAIGELMPDRFTNRDLLMGVDLPFNYSIYLLDRTRDDSKNHSAPPLHLGQP